MLTLLTPKICVLLTPKICVDNVDDYVDDLNRGVDS